MAEATNRRAYQMSVMALLFPPCWPTSPGADQPVRHQPGGDPQGQHKSDRLPWVFWGTPKHKSCLVLATGLAV